MMHDWTYPDNSPCAPICSQCQSVRTPGNALSSCNPFRRSTAQELLESWWNEDPEMRYTEILCGKDLRVCVRLYQIFVDREPELVGEGEAGTLEYAN
jgi:hypothetical protein